MSENKNCGLFQKTKIKKKSCKINPLTVEGKTKFLVSNCKIVNLFSIPLRLNRTKQTKMITNEPKSSDLKRKSSSIQPAAMRGFRHLKSVAEP